MPLAAVRIGPRLELATTTVASPAVAALVVVVVGVVGGRVAAGALVVVGALAVVGVGGACRSARACSYGGQGRRVDDAGGFDTERVLELLEGGGQLVGPDTVDGAVPEARRREHGLDCGGVGQVGGRRLQAELGQLRVERLGGGPVDEPGRREVAVVLQSLHGVDGGGAVDPVDGTVVVADLLQLGLQCRRVRRHLLDGLGLLLVGEAAGIVEEPEPGDLERERRRVVLGGRLRQWGRGRDPLAGFGRDPPRPAGRARSWPAGRASSSSWSRARRAGRHARRGGHRLDQGGLRVGELLARPRRARSWPSSTSVADAAPSRAARRGRRRASGRRRRWRPHR